MNPSSAAHRALALLLSALLLAGCGVSSRGPARQVILGSGQAATTRLEVSGFEAVRLEGGGRLEIEVDGSESLTISADDNVLPYLVGQVRGGTLTLGTAEGTAVTSKTAIIYRVKARALNRIEVVGGADVEATGIQADELVVRLEGGARMKISGQAASQRVTFTGGGSYNAENLESERAQVQCTGAGALILRVSEELDVRIDGAAVVEYIGQPRVTKDISGLGIVRERQP